LLGRDLILQIIQIGGLLLEFRFYNIVLSLAFL
jgi:hypothetical protein